MTRLYGALRVIALPLSLLIAFGLFVVLYRLLNLPSPDSLLAIAESSYAHYGYWVVFIGALAEGMLVANWYLPGSGVIVFGVVISAKGSLNVLMVLALVVLGFWITSVINYGLGRYGWYHLLLRFGLREPLERMRQRVHGIGLRIVFATYFHPNVGALAAASCGILRLPFIRFNVYSLAALLIWNSLWTAVVYLVGPKMLRVLNVWLILPVLVAWMLYALSRYWWRIRELSKGKQGGPQ